MYFKQNTVYITELKSKMPTILCDEKHPPLLLERLAEKRNRGEFCDVAFLVEGETHPAHKCVMAASSDYFAAMINGNFNEESVETVLLKDMKSEAFEQILNFIYSGCLKVDTITVMSIYKTADILQFASIMKLCEKYILQDINPETCIDYLYLSNVYDALREVGNVYDALREVSNVYDALREVGNEAVKCVLFHLEEVAKFGRVKDLPYSLLDTIVQSNEPRCSEKVVLDVICNWLLHHPEVTKEEHEHLIAQCRRHGLITSQDVDILHTHKDVIGKDHALNMYSEMLKHATDQKKRCLQSSK